MKNELISKDSLSMELTIDVDIHFAYNGDSLLNYYVWLDDKEYGPKEIYYSLTTEQHNEIDEAIEERIQEIKNEGN